MASSFNFTLLITLMQHLRDRQVKAPLGRSLALRIKPQIKKTPTGINIFPLTYHKVPYSPLYLSPRPTFEIEQENVALYVHALFGLAESYVVAIDGLQFSLVFAFFRLAEKNWKDLCQDIEMGTLKSELPIEHATRLELQKHLTGDPA